MNKIIHLSLARKSVPVFMDVVQGATAPAIEFVLDDYTPPSNARARIYIKKDGGEVYNNCTLSGNVVTYTPTAGSFDVPGQCVAQLELVQGSTVAVSWRIFVTVEPNLINGSAAPASTEYGALTQLIVNAQRYDSIIGANNITGYNNRQGWTTLTSGQDLNSVLGPGTYISASANITNTLLNIPTNPPLGGGFKMLVENMGGNSYFRQTITMPQNTVLGQLATVERTYKRQTTNGGSTWSDWIFEPTRVELNAIANRGGKNLLPNNATTQTINGITYTRNADGSITANGTATSGAPLLLSNVTGLFSRDKMYRLTGCPPGGGNSTYALYLGGSPNRVDNGNGVTFYGDGVSRTCQIHIFEGVTVNDLTFYPMICEASIQDDTYVPYGMSNAELTDAIKGQSEIRPMLNGFSLLDTSIVAGKYYSTNSIDVPTGTSTAGYFEVTTRNIATDLVRRVVYQPYNSYDVYVNMLQNNGTWSGWRSPGLYMPGETVNIGVSSIMAGHVTSSGAALQFFLPLPKDPSGRTVTVSSKKLTPRGVLGYIGGASTSGVDLSGATWEMYTVRNGIWFSVSQSTAFANVTNNTPIDVSFSTTTTITFE